MVCPWILLARARFRYRLVQQALPRKAPRQRPGHSAHPVRSEALAPRPPLAPRKPRQGSARRPHSEVPLAQAQVCLAPLPRPRLSVPVPRAPLRHRRAAGSLAFLLAAVLALLQRVVLAVSAAVSLRRRQHQLRQALLEAQRQGHLVLRPHRRRQQDLSVARRSAPRRAPASVLPRPLRRRSHLAAALARRQRQLRRLARLLPQLQLSVHRHRQALLVRPPHQPQLLVRLRPQLQRLAHLRRRLRAGTATARF